VKEYGVDVYALSHARVMKADMVKKTATKSNPQLWEHAKNVATQKMGGHSARAMQYATKWYKKHGGGYKGSKSSSNSLHKWSKADWDYAGKKGHSRYLPKSVRQSLSSGEKAATNRKKERANKGGKKEASYSKSIAKKVEKASQ